MQNGALELEGGELSFQAGSDGRPKKVEGKTPLPMMAVVADMMIFANAAVAHRIAGAFPGAALLRRHAPPRPEGFEQVAIIPLLLLSDLLGLFFSHLALVALPGLHILCMRGQDA
jgi:exoribonuclease R